MYGMGYYVCSWVIPPGWGTICDGVNSVNVPSIILDYKCTFTVVLQSGMKSLSPPSIGNYNNVN